LTVAGELERATRTYRLIAAPRRTSVTKGQ
jgi:hypothetical protein